MSDQRSAASAAHPDWIGEVRDHKAWAKRLVYRVIHGDKDVSSLQERFAKEALGLDQNAKLKPN
jgi:hypothetical protein